MITHKSIIHGKCPINGQWDYYDVEVRTQGLLEIGNLEAILDSVRGMSVIQEVIANVLRERLPADCILIVRGGHSQNTTTTVEL